MGLEIKLSEPIEIERFILVLNLGLLHAIEQGLISTEEASNYFHRPLIAEYMKKLGGREELVSLLQDCCMLEDVERLVPEFLGESLKEYARKTSVLLDSLPKKEMLKFLFSIEGVQKWD